MRRFPSLAQIAPVYGVIVMFIYGWTILRFLWKAPSWLYFLSTWELVSVLAYAFVVNLLESLALIGMLLLAAALLPRQWLLDAFISRGAVFSTIGLGYLAVCSGNLQADALSPLPLPVLRIWPLVLAIMLGAALLASRSSRHRAWIEDLAGRAVVFVFLSIPLSLVAVVLVVVRNL